MKKKELSYEGIIHSSWRKKILLKVNFVLIPIFTFITLILISISFGDPNTNYGSRRPNSGESPIENIIGVPELFFWFELFIVIIPYAIIMIILSLSLSIYIKNYTFSLTESNIIIQHGVFTKTKASIPYIQIQNISIVNGIFDRIFKLYTVKIETAARGGAPSSPSMIRFQPEGQIPGIKEPNIIEDKINQMIRGLSRVSSQLEDKIFRPEELAFDNFISYILSKMREGEELKTNIKELREKLNISSVQLAEKVGVPIQTIKFLEEGKYNPSLSLAFKVAKVLNCKVEELFQLV